MKIYQVDAFTDHTFGGNPAAVCPLESWLSEDLMQRIAMENNLSETAFIVRKDDVFEIRWFTPELEIDLCGHATLASAHVIFHHLGYDKNAIYFKYAGGLLTVTTKEGLLSMDFPTVIYSPIEVTDQITAILGKKPIEAFVARDLMVLFASEKNIADLKPDFIAMAQLDHLGVIATAPGEKADFVSRFFAPRAGINEDPVTGSAHCMLIPFWAERLNKTSMSAMQLSKRVGHLHCEYNHDRVLISGNAVTYMVGEMFIH
jgi:PhzF family phenazine biosynthesis protein